MTTRKLNKTEWRSYLDALSKLLETKQPQIEVASLRLGEQVQAECVPLIGVTYDPKNDLVEIALEGLDHMIRGPREIHVQDDAGALTSIEIVGADGVKQIVNFRDQLLLPSSQ